MTGCGASKENREERSIASNIKLLVHVWLSAK